MAPKLRLGGLFMLDTLYSQVGAALLVLVVVFAFWKGDDPEKMAAGAYGLGWIASLLVQDNSDLFGAQWGMFAIDVVMLAVLSALVWRAGRNWPVWAAALQMIIVASHLLMLANIGAAMKSYYTVINLAGYGVLIAIGVGTFWAWQERRAAGLE